MPDPTNPSVVRRFLLWWFSRPANPLVAADLAVDFEVALDYLAGLEARDGVKVSVQHLVAGAICHALVEHPIANARIFGGSKIVPQEHVGIFMPVDLMEKGKGKASSRELSGMILEQAERKSLREIAAATTRTVRAEREGKVQSPFVRVMLEAMERMPDRAAWRFFDALDAALERPAVAQRVFPMLPVTTGLSNIGSHISQVEGLRYRGGSISLPGRLVQVGTFWGVTGIQEEVWPVGGVPTVRRVLPILFLFDHRLVDGVLAGRIASTFGRVLADPAHFFGATGDAPGPGN